MTIEQLQEVRERNLRGYKLLAGCDPDDPRPIGEQLGLDDEWNDDSE